jgi:hypothetical protein
VIVVELEGSLTVSASIKCSNLKQLHFPFFIQKSTMAGVAGADAVRPNFA